MRGGRFSAGQLDGLSIGLLGGSFDPPHAGHRLVSLAALKILELDFIWWLVSPQNPLKNHAPDGLNNRLAAARVVAAHPKIYVSDEETRFGTQYAIDMLRRLKAAHRATNFVWLMGADNLASLHRWKDWTDFAKATPMAIYPRPHHTMQAMHSRAALRYAAARKHIHHAKSLKFAPPPAWILLNGKLNNTSSTALRKKDGK